MHAVVDIPYTVSGTKLVAKITIYREGYINPEIWWRCSAAHLGVESGTWDYFQSSAKVVLYDGGKKRILTLYDLPLEIASPFFPFDKGDKGQAWKHSTAGAMPLGGHDWECTYVSP